MQVTNRTITSVRVVRTLLMGLLAAALVGFTAGCDTGGTNGNGDVGNDRNGDAEDTTAPAAPTDLTGESMDSAVNLTWAAVDADDLNGYNVYRDTETIEDVEGMNPENGSALSDTTYTDNDVENGTTYHYVVTAADGNGNESTPSENEKIKVVSKNWEVVHLGGSSSIFRKVTFFDEQVGYVFGHNGIFLTTNDGGENWFKSEIVEYRNLEDISFPAKSVGYVVADGVSSNNSILKTLDGGETWNEIAHGWNTIKTDPRTIFFIDKNLGFVGGSDGANGDFYNIGVTSDGGSSWNGVESIYNPVQDIFFLDESYGYAIHKAGSGATAVILKTKDGGSTWRKIFSEDNGGVVGPVHFISPDVGFVGEISSPGYSVDGLDGTISKTTDGGGSWKLVLGKQGGIDTSNITSIDFADGKGFAVTSSGDIFVTTDGGNSWNISKVDISGYENQIDKINVISSVKLVNKRVAFAVGGTTDRGVILKYTKD